MSQWWEGSPSTNVTRVRCRQAEARFTEARVTLRARKAIAKSRNLRLQSCFIHLFLIWTEVLFIQQVSGVYSSPVLDTNELNIALPSRKVSGTFEKRTAVVICGLSLVLVLALAPRIFLRVLRFSSLLKSHHFQISIFIIKIMHGCQTKKSGGESITFKRTSHFGNFLLQPCYLFHRSF